jgi:hypothetical protein
MEAKSSAGVPLSSPAAAQRCAEGAGLDSGTAAEAQSALPSIAFPAATAADRRLLSTNAAAPAAPQLQSRISTSLTDVTHSASGRCVSQAARNSTTPTPNPPMRSPICGTATPISPDPNRRLHYPSRSRSSGRLCRVIWDDQCCSKLGRRHRPPIRRQSGAGGSGNKLQHPSCSSRSRQGRPPLPGQLQVRQQKVALQCRR